MKNTVEFDIVKTTVKLKEHLQGLAPDAYDDVEVGSWELKVVVTDHDHLDEVNTEYVGPYKTKQEAHEAKMGLKRSKTYE